MKNIEEHLMNVVSSHQRDWDERLSLFLLANRASTRETNGVMLANVVVGKEFRLPFDKGRSVTDHAADVVERLRDTHQFARHHLKVASDRIKTR